MNTDQQSGKFKFISDVYLMGKKTLQSLNDTDKQFMNIGPNYLSCISSQQQTS
jgi:hypothetical protein